jgi:hypothetical protein
MDSDNEGVMNGVGHGLKKVFSDTTKEWKDMRGKVLWVCSCGFAMGIGVRKANYFSMSILVVLKDPRH